MWDRTRLRNLTCEDNDPKGDVSRQVWPMYRPEGPCEVTFEGELDCMYPKQENGSHLPIVKSSHMCMFVAFNSSVSVCDDQWRAWCLIELDNNLVPPKYLIKNNCSYDKVVPLLSPSHPLCFLHFVRSLISYTMCSRYLVIKASEIDMYGFSFEFEGFVLFVKAAAFIHS